MPYDQRLGNVQPSCFLLEYSVALTACSFLENLINRAVLRFQGL